MNASLKTDLESLVLDFENTLKQINIKDFNDYQVFVDKCQVLLNTYRTKMLNSAHVFSSHQPISEYYLEDYIPSLKYHSECQYLLEVHVAKSFLD